MAETMSFINLLPEDCVSTIISLTSPTDACNTFFVSSIFRSAADSDIVWERFLPSDYEDIVSKSVTPLKFSSKRELFFQLCRLILIDGGNKSFSLEKSFGRKSYVISARELSILHSNEPAHWSWNINPNSRFAEVVELKTVAELKIEGKISTQLLSTNTKYGAYLIMQISNGAYGLDAIPSEISIKVGDHEATSTTAYLSKKTLQIQYLVYTNRMRMLNKRVIDGDERVPRERKDEWMEIELGEFFSGDHKNDEEVKMSLMEVKGHQLKGGLIVEGIEVRPKN